MHSGCRTQRADFRPQPLQGKVVFQGYHLLIDKLNGLKKHLLYLATASENPDHVLDLEAVFRDSVPPHPARLSPSSLASFLLLPLKHRCSSGALPSQAPLRSWLQGTFPLNLMHHPMASPLRQPCPLLSQIPPLTDSSTAPPSLCISAKFCHHLPGRSSRFKPLISLDSSSPWFPTLSPNGMNSPILAQICPHSHCLSHYHLQGYCKSPSWSPCPQHLSDPNWSS